MSNLAETLSEIEKDVIRLIAENATLKKENEELRQAANFQMSSNMDRYFKLKRQEEKLIKARGLIRNLLRVTYGEGWNYSLEWKEKAEQFLSDSK